MPLWRSRRVPSNRPPRRPEGLALRDEDRVSHGIKGFIDCLGPPRGLDILDLGSISHGTANFLGQSGHHIHYVSMLHGFDAVRKQSLGEDGNITPSAANRFIRASLGFGKGRFHGVLAWDVLQHLDDITMRAAIAYLSKILLPNAAMFCIFHADTKGEPIPVLSCSVKSHSTLRLREVGRRTPFQALSARGLETLFPQYRTVNLYLKRDAVLEVLVYN